MSEVALSKAALRETLAIEDNCLEAAGVDSVLLLLLLVKAERSIAGALDRRTDAILVSWIYLKMRPRDSSE